MLATGECFSNDVRKAGFFFLFFSGDSIVPVGMDANQHANHLMQHLSDRMAFDE